MVSIATLIGGALANALAFTGGSYLFHGLSCRQHNRQERIDFINNQLRLKSKAETKFTELNKPMREYHEVFGHELPPLP